MYKKRVEIRVNKKCQFCKNKVEEIDYKDEILMRTKNQVIELLMLHAELTYLHTVKGEHHVHA